MVFARAIFYTLGKIRLGIWKKSLEINSVVHFAGYIVHFCGRASVYFTRSRSRKLKELLLSIWNTECQLAEYQVPKEFVSSSDFRRILWVPSTNFVSNKSPRQSLEAKRSQI